MLIGRVRVPYCLWYGVYGVHLYGVTNTPAGSYITEKSTLFISPIHHSPTNLHTHTDTDIQTHMDTFKDTRTHTEKHRKTEILIHTHTYTHIHTHT